MKEFLWLFLGACIGSATVGGEIAVRSTERDHARAEASACVDERRQCGKDLDWCQTTVRGTLFYITDKLLDDDEGRSGR